MSEWFYYDTTPDPIDTLKEGDRVAVLLDSGVTDCVVDRAEPDDNGTVHFSLIPMMLQMGPTQSLDDVVAELGIDESCHCGDPIDASEFRNRGMCTHCDDVRCDAYPGECGR